METNRHDVVVVGGGAAGLAGAIALARSRRDVLVIDAGEPRNAPADGVHNLLGREGIAPLDLVRAGRAELDAYGGRVRDARVSAVERTEDGFVVTLDDGSTAHARRLLLATGLVDELPEVPGLSERWGHEVLHCPFCHGWEVRDRLIGVLVTSPAAWGHQLPMWRQLSDRVVALRHTGPAAEPDVLAGLVARGVEVVDGEVTQVLNDGDHGALSGVRLADGREVPLEVLVVAPTFRASTALTELLGLEVEPVEMAGRLVATRVAAEPGGATAVPGVWVAGNLTDPMAQVGSAAAAGVMAGAQINGDLALEDTRRASEVPAA